MTPEDKHTNDIANLESASTLFASGRLFAKSMFESGLESTAEMEAANQKDERYKALMNRVIGFEVGNIIRREAKATTNPFSRILTKYFVHEDPELNGFHLIPNSALSPPIVPQAREDRIARIITEGPFTFDEIESKAGVTVDAPLNNDSAQEKSPNLH